MSDKQPDTKQSSFRMIPLKITLVYLVVATLWILFSDQILLSVASTPAEMARLQSYKGNFYVLVTAIMLYWLIRRGVHSARRSQEAEYKSEQGYRQLMEQAEDGIFVTDAQGNYIDVTPKGLEILGYNRAELLQLNLTDVIDRDDLAVNPLQTDELRRLGKPLMMEWLLRRRDNSKVAVDIIAKILPDGRMFGTIRDITERKQSENLQRQIKEALFSLHGITTNPQSSFGKKIQQLFQLGRDCFQLPLGVLSRIEGERYEIVEAMAPGAEVVSGAVYNLLATCCQVTVRAAGPIGFSAPTETVFSRHLGYSGFEVQAYFGMPVMVQNQVYGTLNFFGFKPRDRAFTPADEAILRLMAQWIGGDITRSLANEQINRRNQSWPC
jgi:PAS domain S-box-containing protein